MEAATKEAHSALAQASQVTWPASMMPIVEKPPVQRLRQGLAQWTEYHNDMSMKKLDTNGLAHT